MRSQIYTEDIVNLEKVSGLDDQENEQRVPTIVPTVEGELSLSVKTIQSLLEDVSDNEPNPNTRTIVLATADLIGGFASNGLENCFDPIERVEDIKRGNVGAILGMQVVINDKTPGPCLAVAVILDEEAAVSILSYSAAAVKL